MLELVTEYRIIGRFRKDEKFHVVDLNRHWDLVSAQRRLKQLQSDSENEMKNKRRKEGQVGCFRVSVSYDSDYDLLDLKIQSRKVSKWSDMK